MTDNDKSVTEIQSLHVTMDNIQVILTQIDRWAMAIFFVVLAIAVKVFIL